MKENSGPREHQKKAHSNYHNSQGALSKEPPDNMNPIFFAKIEKGKIRLYDQRNFNNYINHLQGKEVQVSVGLVKKQRSNNQNRFLWGVCYKLLSDTTGYIPEEVHDAMRMMFLLDKTREIPTLLSTTGLTTKEFEEYLEKIRIWAAQELSCIIPLPNEVEV